MAAFFASEVDHQVYSLYQQYYYSTVLVYIQQPACRSSVAVTAVLKSAYIIIEGMISRGKGSFLCP